jgi:hypothetical protein
VKRLISAAALTVALASTVPLAAAAADSTSMPPNVATASISAGSSFDVIDKTTGRVIGQLVAIGNKSEVLAASADVRSNQQFRQDQDLNTLVPSTPQQLQAYWNRVLPMLVGGG